MSTKPLIPTTHTSTSRRNTFCFYSRKQKTHLVRLRSRAAALETAPATQNMTEKETLSLPTTTSFLRMESGHDRKGPSRPTAHETVYF